MCPLRDTIAHLTGLPTALLNDVRSITNGEWRFGAGRGVDTVAVFAIGTGIGGGLVINGQLHLGIGGTGGELGHTMIDFNGPRCGCGNYGCLEAYASGPAIAAMGMKAVAQGLTTRIAELCDYDLNRITPELIAKAAEAGDEIAKDIYEKAGFYIGIAAANMCASHWPAPHHYRWRRGAGWRVVARPRSVVRSASGCMSCRSSRSRLFLHSWVITLA